MGGNRGRVKSRNMYKGHMAKAKERRYEGGSQGWG